MIDGVEARLGQLESVEVARHGEVLGLARATLPVGVEALGEEAQARGERVVAGGHERVRLGAQEGEQRPGVRAVALFQLVRAAHGDAGQIGEGVAPLAGVPELHSPPAVVLRGAEAGHVKGERPALVLAEGAKACHRRAGDAESDRAVDAVEAALAHALGVVEVAGPGIEALGRRPVAPSLGPVAHGAVGSVERGALAEIRRALGRRLDLVGGDEGPAELSASPATSAPGRLSRTRPTRRSARASRSERPGREARRAISARACVTNSTCSLYSPSSPTLPSLTASG